MEKRRGDKIFFIIVQTHGYNEKRQLVTRTSLMWYKVRLKLIFSQIIQISWTFQIKASVQRTFF